MLASLTKPRKFAAILSFRVALRGHCLSLAKSLRDPSIGAACKNLPGGWSADPIAGRGHVVLLPGTEQEAHRQAERIDYSVDFGAEPASGAAESLGLKAPLLSVPLLPGPNTKAL